MRDLAELKINFGGKPIDRPPPTEETVRAFEERFGVRLPASYLALLRHANGGGPEVSNFIPKGSDEDDVWDLNEFYFLDEDRTDDYSLWRNVEVWRLFIGEAYVPIAENGGGDQILLDFRDGGEPCVSICLHEEEFEVFVAADSFEQFIDSLYLDPDMI